MERPAANSGAERRPGSAGGGAIAWQDGAFLPSEGLAVPVGDAGFVLGATVTEQLRTFQGRLFLPDQHALRMAQSLAIVGIDLPMPVSEVFEAAAEVARINHARIDFADDLGLCLFATPGNLPAQHLGRPGSPRVMIHTFPLAFGLWAGAYASGVKLACVSVQQVPGDCWPLALKCRSRMHYHLADREAAARVPGARALLRHADGRVSETTTANIAVVRAGSLVTPPATDALSGVSLGYVKTLAGSLGLGWQEHSLSVDDCLAADELLLTSTPNCLLPATHLDDRPVGGGRPGPVFRSLVEAWSREVGVDIPRQASTMASTRNGSVHEHA